MLAAIQHIAKVLYRELEVQKKRLSKQRRDPTFVRRNVLATLEGSLARFAKHERQELIDAYLLLAPCDHSPMLRMLNERQHPCHTPMFESLAQSTVAGIAEKLVEILRNTDAPTAALEALARRSDPEFIRLLLASIKHPVPLRVVHNMKRLRSVAWLEEHCKVLLELDGRSQAVAVELAAASSISESSIFALLALMMRSGLAEGRRGKLRRAGQVREQGGRCRGPLRTGRSGCRRAGGRRQAAPPARVARCAETPGIAAGLPLR